VAHVQSSHQILIHAIGGHYRYDVIVDILWNGVCMCRSFCNGELGLYEIKLRITQNDGRVSVSVMCQTTARLSMSASTCRNSRKSLPPRCGLRS